MVVEVVVEVVVAALLAGGVAVVVAHGQVGSPSLRVKRSHSSDGCGRLRSLRYAFVVDMHVRSRVTTVCFVV